jgi:hypothetical protein
MRFRLNRFDAAMEGLMSEFVMLALCFLGVFTLSGMLVFFWVLHIFIKASGGYK